MSFIRPSEFEHIFKLDNVICRAKSFSVENYDPMLFSYYQVNQPDEIKRSVNKRQAEFLAGRLCAISAIHEIDSSVLDIPIGHNRSPIFPKHIVASITHSEGIALCMAARKSKVELLGVDIEKIIPKKTAREIESSIINLKEKQLLNGLELDFETALTLVFSAKESLFKALHPYVQKYFDFSAARLNQLCLKTRTFEFILTQDLHHQFNCFDSINGQFAYNNDYVFTCTIKKASSLFL